MEFGAVGYGFMAKEYTWDKATIKGSVVFDLLPVLDTADFNGSGILHEVVQRYRSDVGYPSCEVLDSDSGVQTEAI